MKILVLTSIYPQPDDEPESGVTPVVRYFVEEWKKEGHEIIVIHNSNRYLIPLEILPKKIKSIINSKVGMVLPTFSQRKKILNKDNGILCYRLPLTKVFPRGNFLNFQIQSQMRKIINILNDNNFQPDVILAHWENPQIPLVSKLKDVYDCKTGLVLHSISYLDKSYNKKLYNKYLKNIDYIGTRSRKISEEAREKLNLKNNPFLCFSGIPESFIDNEKQVLNNKKTNTFLYVGQLIKRKNIDTIIKALNIAYPQRDFHLNIVGIGAMESQLKELAKQLGLEKNIHFLGRMPRENIIELMRETECFTMVSEKEAFGLVYLEAMSSGCITIGSIDEGIDGIIENQKNGFLCNAGNVDDLVSIYLKIRGLSNLEKQNLMRETLNTANKYTNKKAADNYLSIFKGI